jgi:hypothetical protein
MGKKEYLKSTLKSFKDLKGYLDDGVYATDEELMEIGKFIYDSLIEIPGIIKGKSNYTDKLYFKADSAIVFEDGRMEFLNEAVKDWYNLRTIFDSFSSEMKKASELSAIVKTINKVLKNIK